MTRPILALLVLGLAASPAPAQLALPPLGETLGQTLDTVDRSVDRTLERVDGLARETTAAARSLAQARVDRVARLIRRHGNAVERDAAGDPARKGELLLLDPAPEMIETAQRDGFTVLSREDLGELGIAVARLGIPPGLGLARAQARLSALLPGATITADTLNFPGGGGAAGALRARAGAPAPIGAPVGVIDGATGPAVPVADTRGFARGAPVPSDHGSAVASLLRHAGVQRVFVADVYGRDPAAGNALAIARALDWLIAREVRVVSISLVGPANPVVARAVAAAQRRGAVIVAAVGNDGPAAPPAYPASYPGVLAVTGVDGRHRALIEAGRALHLDYAAPGADMVAANAAGRLVRVRGTSFAVPLVAARAAAAQGGNVTSRLDAEAIDLGPRGADPAYGRGLLCAACRRTR